MPKVEIPPATPPPAAAATTPPAPETPAAAAPALAAKVLAVETPAAAAAALVAKVFVAENPGCLQEILSNLDPSDAFRLAITGKCVNHNVKAFYNFKNLLLKHYPEGDEEDLEGQELLPEGQELLSIKDAVRKSSNFYADAEDLDAVDLEATEDRYILGYSEKKGFTDWSPEDPANPEDQKPSDIRRIVDSVGYLSFAQAKEFIKARDTLVFWQELAHRIKVETDFSKAFVSFRATIEKAAGFSNWIDQHKAELNSLRELGLINKALTFLPPEIGGLTSLKTLDLNGNKLIFLPPEMGGLTSLETLLLGGNKLQSVPPEIGELTSLKDLDLGGNSLITD